MEKRTNTKELIEYCDEEISTEMEKLVNANQEEFNHYEMRIDVYNETIYFLRENPSNKETAWEHIEHEKLVKAIKKTKKLNSISFMSGKIEMLRDRIIFKNESVD